MRTFAGVMLAAVLGVALGLYGAIVTVFADGPLPQRILTISAVLLAYIAFSFLLGFLYPELCWKIGFILGAPGALVLVFLTFNRTGLLHYLPTLLLLLPCLFTGVGRNVRTRKAF